MQRFGSLALLLLIVICARSLFFEFFRIPTGSMEPTIAPGDFLLATKYDYGYSPYSAWPLALPEKTFSKRIYAKAPVRGDIVVIRTQPRLIKRLIGLPGDKIQFINSKMFINGVAVKKEFLHSFINKEGLIKHSYKETIGNQSYTIYESENRPSVHVNSQVYLVPKQCYFLLGDNRDNSADSRSTLGYVEEKLLVAKAKFVIIATSNSFNPTNWQVRRFFTNLYK
jgi:signal peptidase I